MKWKVNLQVLSVVSLIVCLLSIALVFGAGKLTGTLFAAGGVLLAFVAVLRGRRESRVPFPAALALVAGSLALLLATVVAL